MVKRLLWANFKLNMSTKAQIAEYMQVLAASLTDEVDVVFFPQLTQVGLLASVYPDLARWAQNVTHHANGAYTGEVSIATLLDLWIQYALLGHSERRQYYGETDQAVAAKIIACVEQGIRPVVCVGETLEEREAGKTLAALERQLSVYKEVCSFASLDLAYEPVRAIGTGLTPTNEDIAEVHTWMRGYAGTEKTRILYGGSSNDVNAPTFIQLPNVDGFLVGWAALDPVKFGKMISATAA